MLSALNPPVVLLLTIWAYVVRQEINSIDMNANRFSMLKILCKVSYFSFHQLSQYYHKCKNIWLICRHAVKVAIRCFVTHFLDLNAVARVEKSKNRHKLIGFMIIHIIFAYTKVFCRGGFIVGVG